jgi:arsenite methyltransferase
LPATPMLHSLVKQNGRPALSSTTSTPMKQPCSPRPLLPPMTICPARSGDLSFLALRAGVLALVIVMSAPAALAQLGARTTEQWLKTLDSTNRVAKLKVDEAVAVLKLKPDAVVADIGAGSGVFTLPLAKAVAGTGKVYAVDIDQGLVDHIAKKAKDEKADNVDAVLGSFTDPRLPAPNVDVAFIYDVLHHIENRAEYLKNLARYLKPTGRIAVIDFHPELGPHRNDPALQITRDETKAWMAAIGFKPVEEHMLYTDKWYVIYAR